MLKPLSLKLFPRPWDRKLSARCELVQIFFTPPPPAPASPICIYTCPFLFPPSLSPLRGGPFFPCSWGPSLPLLPRLGIAISFFSYPQSFSCCSSPLTSASMLESLPFVDTPDAGFLLSCSPEALGKLSALASPFWAPCHLLIRYSHSFTNYLLSCLPCARHCVRCWDMAGKKQTKIPAFMSLPSSRKDRSQTR